MTGDSFRASPAEVSPMFVLKGADVLVLNDVLE